MASYLASYSYKYTVAVINNLEAEEGSQFRGAN